MTRTLDLLRNHDWNMQAVITDHSDASLAALPAFHVRVELIEGPSYGTETTRRFATKAEAYSYARVALGWADTDAKFDALRAALG